MMIILACAAFLVAKWKMKPLGRGKNVIVEPTADGISQAGKDTDL